MMQRLSRFFAQDMAIDLGTANTLVYMKNHGIVIREPSVVAVQKDHRGNYEVLAVGEEAKRMLGRTPGSITAIRPMKDGVISDFDVTQEMLRYFIRQTQKRFSVIRFKPRIIIAVPSGITQVERRAVKEAAQSAGAREVFLIEEPMAAAVGAGLPVTEASGSMIVDIGGGTTEVAIISLAGVVFTKSIRVGGDEIDSAIVNYMKRAYNLMIGERTAEEIKIRVGSAFPLEEEISMEVRGRDSVAGLPKTITITSQEIRDALSDTIDSIVDLVRNALERCPPELSADLVDRGFFLAGGGAMIKGLDQQLSDATGLPVVIADDPLSAVANGTGLVLNELAFLLKDLTGIPK